MEEAVTKDHPLRNANILCYALTGCVGGPAWLGKIEPFSKYPIFFYGDTREAMLLQAKEFIDKAILEFEADYWKNKEQYEKRLAHIKKVHADTKAKKEKDIAL